MSIAARQERDRFTSLRMASVLVPQLRFRLDFTPMRVTKTQVAVAAAVMGRPDGRHWCYDLGQTSGIRGGVLYPMLRRWCDDGLLTDGWEEPGLAEGRPPRRYYMLTDKGRAELAALLEISKKRDEGKFRELGVDPS